MAEESKTNPTVEMFRKEILPILKSEIEPVVAEIVERQLRKSIEVKPAGGAQTTIGDLGAGKAADVASSDGMDLRTRQRKSARFLLSLAASGGDRNKALDFAKGMKDEHVTKALGESTGSAGGFLVPQQMGEFIDSLGAQAIVRGILGARTVPMPLGQISLPRGDSGATMNWVGENTNAPSSQPATGQVVMTAKKAMVVVPISNDLLKDAGAPAQDWVEREARRAYERGEDLAFLRSVGGENSPRGMLSRALAANVFNITHAGATATLAEVYADLGRVVQRLATQNIPMVKCGFAFSKRTEWFLKTLLNANGIPVFADQMAKGQLWGFNYGSTTQIPNNLNTSTAGTNDESDIEFGDFESLVIGDTGELEIDVVKGAAYYDSTSGAVVSGLSQDQTTLVLKKRMDFTSLYDGKDIAILRSVDWQ